MKKDDGMATDILDQYISGYHEYALDEPVHISYVSRDLCEMLGLTEKELLNSAVNMLLPYIHPADGNRYQKFLSQMAEQEKSGALECRVVTKTGEVRHVAVSMKSVREADGMKGYAALTAMEPGMDQMENLQFINDTVPCGLLRYSCEKLPRITFVNDTMLDIMRVQKSSRGEFDPVELYKSNIYLMIAEESRARFSQVLQEVYLKGKPHAGEVSVIRGDGSRGRLFGWITKRQGQEGEEEFQSICMDVTRRYQAKKSEQTESYLSALSCVYDMIFEFDIPARTVCYLQGKVPFFDEYLKGVPMDFAIALNRWLNAGVLEGDQKALKRFLLSHVMRERTSENGPPGIDFSFKEKDEYRKYHGILLRTDPMRLWFCCSELKEHQQIKLENENRALKAENTQMKELVQRFTEGVVAFEIYGDRVKPLYASDNAYAFFGYSEEAWAEMMRTNPTIRDFVSKTGVSYEKFEDLFAKGEAEFLYRDVSSGSERRIRAVCSYPEDGGSFYIMLFNQQDDLHKHTDMDTGTRVRIRTFGYFDVFVNDKPIMFRHEKAKELLALLVDRRGGYVSSEEAIGFLWEDEPASPVVLARYRKVSLRLKNLLEEYGIAEIVESVNGKRRLVTDRVECDLYQYLSQKKEYAELFSGSYLTNYSWGEVTLGELMTKYTSK